ncbi:hypothetical protein BHM03_00024532 [Ensete ventricosum]|uniref:Cation-transporting P-type ATPase N-terminal domain-containing protein n=1 Tax=Ensete ventricosum TaxID=4639 RepID=A0A426X799_ENSVE|nr:hypothetical protein B296_00052035 [Ensete ventricosum]RZR95666.1 hypothetical protein BHM03_00024532 [Ensete ventricosum]
MTICWFAAEHKYEIVKRLQDRKHICGMTGDGVNDAPALKKADIGIAVADATDAARSASDIVLTEPGLSVIVSAVLTSRAIFQRMKNYTIYAVSITIRIVLGFMLIALIWRFDFDPFMVLIIAILNDGTIMTISKDRVKPSPLPDSWKLREIFATGVVLGAYLAIMTVVFFWLAHATDFFPEKFGVRPIRDNHEELTAALYLQVSIISQALIFVTRSRSWSFVERPGFLLIAAFIAAQLLRKNPRHWVGMGWDHLALQLDHLLPSRHPQVHHPLRSQRQSLGQPSPEQGRHASPSLLHLHTRKPNSISSQRCPCLTMMQTAFTTKKDYGRGEREAQWALAQRTLHGLQPADTSDLFNDKSSYRELSEIAEQAKRRAEVAR